MARGVIGFLPEYLKEQFNPGLAYFIGLLVKAAGGSPERVIHLLLFGTLLTIYLMFFLRPAPDGETAIRRCIWPIGAFTLLTQNLFPWYMLWLVPLLAIFRPTSFSTAKIFLGDLPINSWTGWWLFCCLVQFSYIAFIREVSPLLVALRIFASVSPPVHIPRNRLYLLATKAQAIKLRSHSRPKSGLTITMRPIGVPIRRCSMAKKTALEVR